MSELRRQMHVLMWEYSDKSAYGVERIYWSAERAEEDLKLIEAANSSKTFRLILIDVY